MSVLLGTTHNVYKSSVCSTEVPIICVKFLQTKRIPQFCDYDAYVQRGNPNFTIILPIPILETQLFLVDMSIRFGYPYIGINTGIFTSFYTYIGHLRIVFRVCCGYNR